MTLKTETTEYAKAEVERAIRILEAYDNKHGLTAELDAAMECLQHASDALAGDRNGE